MYRDVNAFRERFLRWKAGELVYDGGRVIHAAFGLDDEEPTDAIQRRLTPLEYQRATWRTNALKDQERLAQVLAANYAEVGPLQHVPQQLLEYYANKEDTRRFMERKQKGEELADKIFGTAFDVATLYAPAAKFAFNVAKQAGKRILIPYKEYRLSRAINKAVKENPVIIGYNRNPVIQSKNHTLDLKRNNSVNIGIINGVKRDYNNPINNMLSVLLLDLILGEYIGRGAERLVFTDRRNPDRVIKIGGGINGEENITDFDALNEAIDYTLEMNKLPSVEPISYEGFIEDGGHFIPWFSLKKVTPLNKISDPFQTLTKPVLLPNGKYPTGKLSRIRMLKRGEIFPRLGYTPILGEVGAFRVYGYPYKITDLGQKNIGLDNMGNIKIFDPLIEL